MPCFQFPEVTLGILPGIGGLVIPYRKWPAAAETFTKMLAQNDRLTAKAGSGSGRGLRARGRVRGLVQAAAARARDLVGTVPLSLPDLAGLSARIHPGLWRRWPSTARRSPTKWWRSSCRRFVTASKLPTWPSALEVGYQAFGTVAATKAAAEGIGSFLGGRKPDYTGM